MSILGFDTATQRVAVGVGRGGQVLGTRSLAVERQHAEQLVPTIRDLCQESSIELSSLEVIAVGLGPGLFTGLRVGITTARTMAQALDIPVIGVSSLDLVAHPLVGIGRQVVVVANARRNEIYCARYIPTKDGMKREGDYEVLPPDVLAAELAENDDQWLVVGDGVLAHADAFANCDRFESDDDHAMYPSAAPLVAIADVRMRRQEFCDPCDVHPLYLRRSDAEIEWDRKGR